MKLGDRKAEPARKWAYVRLALGLLQMFGGVLSFTLLLYSGIRE